MNYEITDETIAVNEECSVLDLMEGEIGTITASAGSRLSDDIGNRVVGCSGREAQEIGDSGRYSDPDTRVRRLMPGKSITVTAR